MTAGLKVIVHPLVKMNLITAVLDFTGLEHNIMNLKGVSSDLVLHLHNTGGPVRNRF